MLNYLVYKNGLGNFWSKLATEHSVLYVGLLEINQKYSLLWPVITKKRLDDVPQDAAAWDGVPNKYEEHFSEQPGKGS